MTSKEDQHVYEGMLEGKENVESNLQAVLVEGKQISWASCFCELRHNCKMFWYYFSVATAIAAEITQGVITDVSQAIQWLQSTFFYVRCDLQAFLVLRLAIY